MMSFTARLAAEMKNSSILTGTGNRISAIAFSICDQRREKPSESEPIEEISATRVRLVKYAV